MTVVDLSSEVYDSRESKKIHGEVGECIQREYVGGEGAHRAFGWNSLPTAL